jgi:hypothetical protein
VLPGTAPQRSNSRGFNTPFAPGPGITFRGCTATPCHFDASSVRIVNNTSSAQRIDSVTVKFGSCSINLWPGAVSLAPGTQLIDTQTTNSPVAGCHPETGSIDGTDIGPGSQPYASCAPNGIVPEVDVSIGGTASAFTDSGQVLNAGGRDLAACPGAPNESRQWSKIGSSCGAATLTLAPPSQTHRVGETATLNATLVNGCGQGLQGALVNFVDSSGPNTGLTKTATTEATGVATITYTSSKTGTDGWFAGTQNPAGVIFSTNTVTVTWIPAITYTGRAYCASFLLDGGTRQFISDTGDISTTAATDTPKSVLNIPGPPVSASVLSADVKTTITVGSLTITFNEQKPVAGADNGLEVNAIHASLPGTADVVVASSRSDIHNC